jgi:hypothetical protein
VTDGLDDLSSLSQERFEQARDDIEGATETFRDDLSSLGTPETESGEEARQAVDDFSSTLESESADIEETIDGISGIADLPVVAQDIAASLSSVYSALTMLASIRTGDAQDELGAHSTTRTPATTSTSSCDRLRPARRASAPSQVAVHLVDDDRPSPTADATRFTEPERTSPIAKTPGTLVA